MEGDVGGEVAIENDHHLSHAGTERVFLYRLC